MGDRGLPLMVGVDPMRVTFHVGEIATCKQAAGGPLSRLQGDEEAVSDTMTPGAVACSVSRMEYVTKTRRM